MNRGLLAAGGVHSQLAAFERLLWGGAAPWGGDGSGVAVVLSRTPRSSTVPCIGAVPTWGASVGTGPRPSGQAVPWACRRRQTRTHAYSRTPQVEPVWCLGLCREAGVWGGLPVLSPLWALTEPRASRVPSSDEEVVEEPQNRRTRMSLGTKGLKVNLFPGLSPSALKVPSDQQTRPTTWPAAHLASSLLPTIYSFPHLLLPIFLLVLLSREGPVLPMLCANCGRRVMEAVLCSRTSRGGEGQSRVRS